MVLVSGTCTVSLVGRFDMVICTRTTYWSLFVLCIQSWQCPGTWARLRDKQPWLPSGCHIWRHWRQIFCTMRIVCVLQSIQHSALLKVSAIIVQGQVTVQSNRSIKLISTGITTPKSPLQCRTKSLNIARNNQPSPQPFNIARNDST